MTKETLGFDGSHSIFVGGSAVLIVLLRKHPVCLPLTQFNPAVFLTRVDARALPLAHVCVCCFTSEQRQQKPYQATVCTETD